MPITRGFQGRPRQQGGDRLPPGQHLERGFPVLTAGPTPHSPLEKWTLAVEKGGDSLAEWDWARFGALPQTELRTDIHCVTKWTKLDTVWRGVTFDDLLGAAGLDASPTDFVMAHCDGGYTT
ncbi:molybdopterin-dependent oxidoreductase, partial [Escherichia coli]|uniref:molybdopterin-dependent oxidoreductase n=1 Tax=Escherichia coli TaxID=562 RepID=UPI003C30BF5B